jgi:hypothetical protein
MLGKIWKFTLFFLLCLFVALLFNLPIQQVLPHVTLPQTVRLAGIDGTIVDGKAREIRINDFPIQNVRYSYQPSCIPLLKVCYRIDYDQGRLQAAYDLLNGDTEINDLRIVYPVSEVVAYVPNLLVNPTGRVELLVDEVSMVAGRPAALAGKLVWRDLGIDNDGVRINIGDYELDFVGDSSGYDFELKDRNATLDVDGEGRVSADGQYSSDIRILTDGNLDSNVRYVLNLAAKKTGPNSYRIEQSGRLPARVRSRIFP